LRLALRQRLFLRSSFGDAIVYHPRSSCRALTRDLSASSR
jgi:hypothetical protein